MADNRYNHWFWNSKLVDFVSSVLVRANSWLWFKQYGKNR